jgi:hypothetical protein
LVLAEHLAVTMPSLQRQAILLFLMPQVLAQARAELLLVAGDSVDMAGIQTQADGLGVVEVQGVVEPVVITPIRHPLVVRLFLVKAMLAGLDRHTTTGIPLAAVVVARGWSAVPHSQ